MNNQISSLAVSDPEISEVLDLTTGAYRTLADVVGTDFATAVQLRTATKIAQKQERPLFLCAECFVAVNLLMHPVSRLFFFKHEREDGRCSAVTRGVLSKEEINARKYNGAKESWLHFNTKSLVARSLNADPRFSDIVVEGTWRSSITGALRRPDVCAIYHESAGTEPIRVAFEIQLSTTYLDVIVDRRLFYLAEGGLLFWIFAQFNDVGRRLTQDDVFFNNNQNAFLVNEVTASTSLLSEEFHLDCAWAEPTSQTLSSSLQRKMVRFDELILNQAAQQAYYFDFYGKRRALKQLAQTLNGPLRAKFDTFWLGQGETPNEDLKTWRNLSLSMKQAGVTMPAYPGQLPANLLNIIYSARQGRVISWNYATLVQLAHWVVATYKPYLQIFRKALLVYDRVAQIKEEDKNGNWLKKVVQYKMDIAAGDPQYAPDNQHDELIEFLFPELFE